MTSSTSSSITSQKLPVGAVLLAAVGAQFVDDVTFAVLPPLALLAPLGWLIAIALTAGAARWVTRGRHGVVVARTGLAVGGASALIGLLADGVGLAGLVLAVLTVVAGVAGAVVGRPRQVQDQL